MKSLTLLTGLLSVALHSSMTAAWAINYFSDDNCQNWVGQDNGSDDPGTIGWTFAFDECESVGTVNGQGNPWASAHAGSFQIWMPPCFQGRLSIGGERKWSDCSYNMVCYAEYVDGSYNADNACKKTNGKEIIGFSVAYNPRSGPCNQKRDTFMDVDLQEITARKEAQEVHLSKVRAEIAALPAGVDEKLETREIIDRAIVC